MFLLLLLLLLPVLDNVILSMVVAVAMEVIAFLFYYNFTSVFIGRLQQSLLNALFFHSLFLQRELMCSYIINFVCKTFIYLHWLVKRTFKIKVDNYHRIFLIWGFFSCWNSVKY